MGGWAREGGGGVGGVEWGGTDAGRGQPMRMLRPRSGRRRFFGALFALRVTAGANFRVSICVTHYRWRSFLGSICVTRYAAQELIFRYKF